MMVMQGHAGYLKERHLSRSAVTTTAFLYPWPCMLLERSDLPFLGGSMQILKVRNSAPALPNASPHNWRKGFAGL